MVLPERATEFFDKNVPRHGYLSTGLKTRIWKGVESGKIKPATVTKLGKRIREHIADTISNPVQYATAVERFGRLQNEVQAMPIRKAVKHLIRNLGPKETAIVKRRRELAKAIIAGRQAERQGGYELSRGITAHNRWLGVNLQHEARALARIHGPITVLDAGGGTGFAMADLKSRLRTKIKETHATSLTQHFSNRVASDIETHKEVVIPASKPYPDSIAPVMHVAHIEKIPLPSSSVHLITSVRGATWYTPRTIHRSVGELVRILRPGGRAFLHLMEPNKEAEARLSSLFKREQLKHTYTYGVVAAKRSEDKQVKNELHIVKSRAERDRIAKELQRGFEEGKYDYVTKYRVLALEKQ